MHRANLKKFMWSGSWQARARVCRICSWTADGKANSTPVLRASAIVITGRPSLDAFHGNSCIQLPNLSDKVYEDMGRGVRISQGVLLECLPRRTHQWRRCEALTTRSLRSGWRLLYRAIHARNSWQFERTRATQIDRGDP